LVLQTLVAAQERQKERIPNASQRIAHLLADSLDSASVGPLLRDLVRDGLVADIDDGRIEDQNVGMPPHTESRPVLRAQHYHDVTNRGHGFLAFIAGPFDSRDSVPQVT
jgi:hypothetical protein